MKFIKEIRSLLGFTQYRIAQELGFPSTYGYTQFENSRKAVNIEKLIKLWRISGMSAKAFLEMIEEEVLKEDALKEKSNVGSKKSPVIEE